MGNEGTNGRPMGGKGRGPDLHLWGGGQEDGIAMKGVQSKVKWGGQWGGQ